MMTTSMTPAAAAGDEALVEASLAGDREAFGRIVLRYQSLVCALAYSVTGNLGQSEDLAQESFLAAWKHLAELREPAKLRAWLCGIARNVCNNALRSLGREPSHGAEPLEAIPESRSPEPLPVERAISREEAEILWRSLERIPENYRLPLVLFYREHQSIEAVAHDLDLTEEAVRQRLSRGRKLLQEEVLAFVEGALERTAPGKAFTVAVVAALPLAVTTAKAASVGAAVAKGGAAAKSILPFTAFAAGISMLGAILFSWKTAVDDSRSPQERRFLARMAWYQVAFFVVSMMGIVFCSVLALPYHPWGFATALALLVFANVVNGVLVLPYTTRRKVEIRVEEGTLAEEMPDAVEGRMEAILGDRKPAERRPVGPGAVTGPNAVGRAIRLTIPFLVMFAGTGVALPWKQHWVRCAVVMAAQALIILWFYRRMLRHLRFEVPPPSARGPAFMQNPFIRSSLILFGTALLGGVGGYLLPLFLHPEAARSGMPHLTWLGPLGVCLLLAVLAYAAFAALFVGTSRKTGPRWRWLAGISELPFLRSIRNLTRGAEAVAEATYAPLFQQLDLGPDQRAQLKDLVLKRTMVGVRVGISLMNRRLDAEKRAKLTREAKSETDGFEARIKEFLGAENYVVFQRFERTIPDRTMLDTFTRRCAGTPATLSPEQQARLLPALTEARGQYPWTTEFSRRNPAIGDFAAQFTEENLEAFAREEEQFARQFLTQAQELLNPEQLAMFEKALERHRRSQIAQSKMAARLFAPGRG